LPDAPARPAARVPASLLGAGVELVQPEDVGTASLGSATTAPRPSALAIVSSSDATSAVQTKAFTACPSAVGAPRRCTRPPSIPGAVDGPVSMCQ